MTICKALRTCVWLHQICLRWQILVAVNSITTNDSSHKLVFLKHEIQHSLDNNKKGGLFHFSDIYIWTVRDTSSIQGQGVIVSKMSRCSLSDGLAPFILVVRHEWLVTHTSVPYLFKDTCRQSLRWRDLVQERRRRSNLRLRPYSAHWYEFFRRWTETGGQPSDWRCHLLWQKRIAITCYSD